MRAKRVLIVEDEAMVRYLAAEMLRDEGYEVVEADDGDEATRHLRDPYAFDVLLTDVQIPGARDGIEVVNYARALHPKIGVVVMSGYALSLTERLAALPQPHYFLSKPYRLRQLVELIHEAARCD